VNGFFGWLSRQRFDRPPGPTGWLDLPIRRAMAAELPTYRAAWRREQEPARPIFLYKAWLDLLGVFPAYVAQEIGDCTSQGFGRGWDLLQAVEVALGRQSTYREVWTEYLYGASRRAAGLLGTSGDGSFGSATAKAAIETGVVPRLRPYSGETAKSWGYYGPPADLAVEARPLGSVALIETWADLVSALWNGYPVAVCSDRGFTLERDREGFCAPRGQWAHCMLIGGAKFGRRPGACILQSWGPDVPGGPLADGQPSFSFWADKEVVERMLAQGDTFALSDSPELSPRNLPGSYTRW